MVFSNGLMKHEKDYKEYIVIKYANIDGYSITIQGKEKLPWKGNKKLKPREERCLKFVTRMDGKPHDTYFCVFYSRADWTRSKQLSIKVASFINEIWVSMINKQLLEFNLKDSQDKMLRTINDIHCNSHIMEPIKIEYRSKVMIVLLNFI